MKRVANALIANVAQTKLMDKEARIFPVSKLNT